MDFCFDFKKYYIICEWPSPANHHLNVGVDTWAGSGLRPFDRKRKKWKCRAIFIHLFLNILHIKKDAIGIDI